MTRKYNPLFEKIGTILVYENVITEDQLNSALSEQKNKGGKLGGVLLSKALVTEDELVNAYSLQLGHRAVTEDELLKANEDAIKLISEEFAVENRVLVLNMTETTVLVAMEDPEDLAALDSIKKTTNRAPEVVVAGKSALDRSLERLYGNIRKEGEMEDVFGDITVFSGDEGEEEEIDLSSEAVSAEDAPIVKLVNMIILEAIKEQSTDIHVEPQHEKVIIRIRIDGVLQQIMTPPISSLNGIVTRIKILSKLNIAERRLTQDGRFSIHTGGRDIDVRVSILPTIHGEKVVMRLLDKGGFEWNLTSLGFPKFYLETFTRWIRQPYGMVLISGPTGSGKSTTLYSALKEIKTEGTNITTVEDPVEYQLPGVSQVQVHEKIGLTFSSALRSILRQDPDILLIGEVRDEETADIAVKFALTGHLVFSTVHANDAPSTITRLIDIGIPAFLVGSSVNLVMAQRLVRKICSKCKEPYKPTEEDLRRVQIPESLLKGATFMHGKGCAQCRSTGYKGRTGIFEILELRRSIRKLIFDGADEETIREQAEKDNMRTLRESGIEKLVEGTTTFHEVLRSTVEDF